MERYHSICSGIREGYTQGCGETHGHHKGKATSTTAFAFLLPRYLQARLSLWAARASSWRLYKHLHGFSICPVLGPGSLTVSPNIKSMIILHLVCQCIMTDIVANTSCGVTSYKWRCSGGTGGRFQACQGNLGIILLPGCSPAEATDMFIFVCRRSLVFRWRGSNYGLQSQGKLVMGSKYVDELRLSMRPPNVSVERPS